jgi:glycosyltransferase involved in cell wall biosynthesis
MPVLNEARYLASAVDRILKQSVDQEIEVILALGPSSDSTTQIAQQIATKDNRVKLVDNPSGKTPSGLNKAIAASQFEVIVRVDGHSYLPDNYINNAVRILNQTNADVVGGVMAANGETNFEVAVAAAMRSAFGVGPARFHTGGKAGEVNTVYLGVFRKSALARVGGYDETFLRAQDWEMNYRIRKTGGKIWFDPELEVGYRPRSSIKKLARQYFDYGRWRREVARTYPDTKSLRYLAPPFTVTALIASFLSLFISTLLGFSWSGLFWIPILSYLLLVLIGSMIIFNKRKPISLFWQPIVVLVMHLCWGIGFLTSPKNLRAQPKN